MNTSELFSSSLIDALWHGNVQPLELGIGDTPEMADMLKQLSEKSTELASTLSEEQLVLFRQWEDCENRYEFQYETAVFAFAFKLGARMMMEILKK